MTPKTFDPGLTLQFNGELRRTINPDGSFNVHRRGTGMRAFNPYLFLIDTSWPRFLFCVFLAYLTVNVIFATVFTAIGIENLHKAEDETQLGPFMRAFFFSVHTLTTVGYGSMYPKGLAMNIASSIEAATGLMGFALATGLLYGRFSRPNARIVFSHSMIVAPYQNISGLQFRIANERTNTLMDVEAKILMMTVENENGELKRRYADLTLERAKVNFFPLTWTVVHPIDESSPLFGRAKEDLSRLETEFLIVVKAFDVTFGQPVNVRYSYRHEELVWGARFAPAFFVDHEGDLVLEVDRVSELQTT